MAFADDCLERGSDGRRMRLIARDDLQLPAAHAGRDLDLLELHAGPLRLAQRRRDLGLRQAEQAQGPLLIDGGVVNRAPEGLGPRRLLPERLKLARRAGQDDDGRAFATVGRRHHEPRGGADRLEDRRTGRDDRLLAVRFADRLIRQVRPARPRGRQDRGDPLLQRHVEHHRASAEGADDGRREVVGSWPQSAAGDDQRHLQRRAPPQRREHVGRAVANDRDMREVDPELAQALGQPWAVAVADTPAQHLGAGDDNRRPRAHEQCGADAAASLL